jgi:hypothetical protein
MEKSKLDKIPNLWVYDTEVFAHDWMFVAYQPSKDRFVSFHNNSPALRKWMNEEHPFLAGFNNKRYDDYIVLGMIKGNKPEVIKSHNDYIIEGNPAWNHPSVANMKSQDYFQSMDTMSDLPVGMSLKRIQGNCCENIVESPIDFTVERKLNKEEASLVMGYCKNDVEATYRLMNMRKDYFETKLDIASMGNINPFTALGSTNGKLVSMFLCAEKMDYPNNNEFSYKVPDCVQLGEHGEQVLDFYRSFAVRSDENETVYDKSLSLDLNNVKLKIGWGGIHGAKENFIGESTEERKIVDIDVGSYYPSMMLRFGYFSEALTKEGKERYKSVYMSRMKNKREGNNERAGAQKLVLNTAYGCTKNKHNDMYHPQTANNICITGQLLLIDLMEKLDKYPSFELIQANTDGIIFSYDVADEKKIRKTVSEWEKRSGMNMEYVNIHKIVQKDVNNYVMLSGETYVIKNGKKTVLKEDKNKEVCRGSWTNQKSPETGNTSFAIVKEALCKKLLYDIPVETTINQCNDIFKYQMVVQARKDASVMLSYRNGVSTPQQKVNRIYASSDHMNNGVYWKMKNGGNDKLVTDSPEFAVVDNDNHLTIKDIDKEWYINMANERVRDFMEERKKGKKRSVPMMDLFAMLDDPSLNMTEPVKETSLQGETTGKTDINKVDAVQKPRTVEVQLKPNSFSKPKKSRNK